MEIKTLAVKCVEIPVPSTSDASKTHYVRIAPTCTCDGFRFGAACKHVDAILKAMAAV